MKFALLLFVAAVIIIDEHPTFGFFQSGDKGEKKGAPVEDKKVEHGKTWNKEKNNSLPIDHKHEDNGEKRGQGEKKDEHPTFGFFPSGDKGEKKGAPVGDKKVEHGKTWEKEEKHSLPINHKREDNGEKRGQGEKKDLTLKIKDVKNGEKCKEGKKDGLIIIKKEERQENGGTVRVKVAVCKGNGHGKSCGYHGKKHVTKENVH